MNNINSFFLTLGLDDEKKQAISSRLKCYKKFKKGELIYSSNKYEKALGLIVKGSAYAVANNSHSVFMNKFSVGKTFGAAALFGNKDSYVSTVIASKDTTVLFINEEELKSIFLEFPITAVNYITFLSDKIRFLNTKLSVISCSNAEDTVLKYLVSVKDETGCAQIPNSMTLLSKMLGIGRATLYRCIDSLEKSGNIIKENNKIKVINDEKNY